LPDSTTKKAPPAESQSTSDRLPDLLDSVNAASGAARTSWLTFVGLLAFFFVTISSVTHKDLLLNSPVKLPILGVELPLSSFFVWGPIVFLLVHFSVLLQHMMLARKLLIFDFHCSKTEPTPDGGHNVLRDELNTYFFTQSVAGAKLHRLYHLTLDTMGWVTLVFLPLALLVYFQTSFLAYHDDFATWWQRFALVADMGVLGWIYAIVRQPRDSHLGMTEKRLACGFRRLLSRGHWQQTWNWNLAKRTVRSLRDGLFLLFRRLAFYRRRVFLGVFGGLLLFLSFCVATLPDSSLDRAMTVVWPTPVPYGQKKSKRRAFLMTAWLFEGGWLARNLTVTDTDLVKDKDFPLKDGEVSLRLRRRNLNYGTFDRSDLHLADLTGAQLKSASLGGTVLNKAVLACLQSKRIDARCTNLQGADLREAGLQGADLRGAKLQGADLSGAGLQGANLGRAELQGAGLFGAQLQSADLREAWIWLTRPHTPQPAVLANYEGILVKGLDKDARKRLTGQVEFLKKLTAEMTKNETPGRERVAGALKRVQEGLGSLLVDASDPEWEKKGQPAWLNLTKTPRPDPVQLAHCLAVLACTDKTEKGYLAQALIRRVLGSVKRPAVFHARFKKCNARENIPKALWSRLEKAAATDKVQPKAKPADSSHDAPCAGFVPSE
jgi:Pentapeptide repeats (8 copies)